ncbi:MAG: ABC transporter ATP-binding protein [Alphaproteobacteria bacterium]|nr:ABC transporter ATP-binding protein [Alphaproteobacteria bacterium]
MTLLAVEGLNVTLATDAGPVAVVHDVGFTLDRRETLGIVGESGCGKTMTALALMGLLPEAARTAGRILFDGEDLLAADEARLCSLRGDRLAMIFQEPTTALNPVHTVGHQVAEVLMLHRDMAETAALAEARRLLDMVGLPRAAERLAAYPHQLSGGQRQRVMIAMALACKPDILVADEPTTALDVTVQAQILDLIGELVRELGMALVLITHDLGVVGQVTDRVAVMYAGRVVESGPTEAIFAKRAHPYTQGLFKARPSHAGQGRAAGTAARLATIPGLVPDPRSPPPGCAFAPRCPHAIEICRRPPPLVAIGESHDALCHRVGEWT